MWNVNHGPSWLSRVEFTSLMILFWELEFEMIIKSLKDMLQKTNRNEKIDFHLNDAQYLSSTVESVALVMDMELELMTEHRNLMFPTFHSVIYCFFVRFFFFNDSKFHLISHFFSLLGPTNSSHFFFTFSEWKWWNSWPPQIYVRPSSQVQRSSRTHIYSWKRGRMRDRNGP